MRVIGIFADVNSALMLLGARLCYIGGTNWDSHVYSDLKHIGPAEGSTEVIAGG